MKHYTVLPRRQLQIRKHTDEKNVKNDTVLRTNIEAEVIISKPYNIEQ